MSFPELILLSLGLSLDAAAICVALGLAAPRAGWALAAEVAAWFGGAHVAFCSAGFLVGSELGPWLGAVDHWVASTVLAAIGAKMLHGALRSDAGAPTPVAPSARTLLALSVAASVDAAAVGVTLPLLDAELPLAAATIGATAGGAAAAGIGVGRRFGRASTGGLEVAGAFVLGGLAVKVLVEHLTRGF